MKKVRSLLAVLLTAAMVLSLSACGGKNGGGGSAPNTSIDVSAGTDAESGNNGSSGNSAGGADVIHAFGGGSSGGGYYTISNVLSQYFNDQGFGAFTAQPTTGGSQNGLLMQAGDLDIAVINGADCLAAYTGSSENFSEPYTNMRAIAVLYSGCLQMLVKNDESIQTLTDLTGRKFGIGGPGSGDNAHAKRVFTACGMDVEKDIVPQYIGVNESPDQLKDGQIDGFLNLGSVPYSVVTEHTLSGKGKVIGLTQEQIDALTTGENAVYFPEVIPAGSYEGQAEDIPTVALPTVLCVDAERISDELAYQITQAIYEDTAAICELYAGFDIDAQASLDAIKVPLHPGAEQYYKEIGLL